MAVQTVATLKANMPVGTAGGTTVQDIHDIVDTFDDRVGKLETLVSGAISAKTASYTAAASDDKKRITFDSATAVTLTIPNSLPAGWECSIFQLGAGQVTVAVTGGALRSRDSHTKTAGQYASAYLMVYANAGTAPQVAFSGDTAL